MANRIVQEEPYWTHDPETGLPVHSTTQVGQIQPHEIGTAQNQPLVHRTGPMLGRRIGGFDAVGKSGRMRSEIAGQFIRMPNAIGRKSVGQQNQTIQNAPKQIISCSATESGYVGSDHTVSSITVQFIRDAHDPNYQYTNIWLQGYHGSNATRLVANAIDSPHSFTLENTGETITIICQAVGITGVSAPIVNAPRTQCVLNGITTAPSAPTISSLTSAITSGATTIGQQFAFNTIPQAESQLIAGYWIYRSSSSTTPVPPASRLKFIPAVYAGTNVYTFTDASGVSTNYYWVSAVNTAQLESSLAAAGTTGGGGGGGTTTTYRPSTNTAVQGGGFGNPTNVYDGNTTTYASASVPYGGSAVESTWQGFPSATGSTSVTLKINSTGSNSNLRYSTNGGTTWTTVHSGSWSQTTDAISISTSVNISNIKIDGVVNAPGVRTQVNSMKIYEAWVEVS